MHEAGDYLQAKIPDSTSHPKSRNSYVHLALCVKKKFGLSYRDLNDNDFKKAVEYVDFLKKTLPNKKVY